MNFSANIKAYFIFSFLIVATTGAFAEEMIQPQSFSSLKHTNKSKAETSEVWQVKTFFEFTDNSFLLAVGDGRGSLDFSKKRIQFNTANDPEIGIQIGKGPYSLRYSTKVEGMKSLAYDDNEVGSTSMTDLKFNVDLGAYGLGVYYQNFNGFYADLNSSSGMTVRTGDQKSILADSSNPQGANIIQRPDISSYNYGLQTWLKIPIYDHKSPDSLILVTTKEDFGIVSSLKAGYRRLAIEGSSPLIPKNMDDQFGADKSIQSIYQHALNAQIGFGMNFYVFDPVIPYFSGSVGKEALIQTIEGGGNSETTATGGDVAEFDLGTKYSANSHHFQVSWKFEIRSGELGFATLDSTRSMFGLEYAYSF